MNNLEKRIASLEARNKKVEHDKKWETSWTRRIAISLLTYAVVLAYLIMIDNSDPFINALVPSVGFLLSTLALKTIRGVSQK